MQNNEMRKTRITLLIIKIGFAILAITFVVLFFVVCRIKTITVVGNRITDDNDIITSSNIKLNTQIYGINENQIANLIMNDNPYITSVDIKKELPSTIKIVIKESGKTFYTYNNNYYYVLTSELKIIEKSNILKDEYKHDLIYLSLPEFLQTDIGETIEFKDSSETKITKEIITMFLDSKLSDEIKEISLKSRFDISIKYDSFYTIVYGDYTNLAQKIENCTSVIAYLDDTSQKREGTIYVLTPDEASFDPK